MLLNHNYESINNNDSDIIDHNYEKNTQIQYENDDENYKNDDHHENKPIEIKRMNGWKLAKGLLGAGIGNLLEWFDFALFGLLANQIGDAFFPKQSQSARTLGSKKKNTVKCTFSTFQTFI